MTTETARIEVFRVGTFTPMEGGPLSYSAADLRAAADAYDPEAAPAPIVVGHPSIDAPAYGWAKSFDFDATTGILHATVGEINPAFAEAVRSGSYKKVSLQFHRPNGPANPVPGTWYPKHIGFLGGAAPAVTGLKTVQFSADKADVVTFDATFGEPIAEEAASLLRSLRDFLISKFSLEEADKALPSYRIEWLAETQIVNPGLQPAFSTPVTPPETTAPPNKEPAVPQSDPAFAAREADFTAREARIKLRETEIAHDGNVSFAEGLVSEGKLLPTSKDKLVSILDAVPADNAVSFAAGEVAVPVAQAIRDLLSAQPTVVSFGALDLPPDPGAGDHGAVSFASDGKTVDPVGMELHAKAVGYQKQHPGTAYLDAVRAVS